MTACVDPVGGNVDVGRDGSSENLPCKIACRRVIAVIDRASEVESFCLIIYAASFMGAGQPPVFTARQQMFPSREPQ